jgi:hypothetical protein
MADALMLDYAIEEAMLDAAMPTEMRSKPKTELFMTISDIELASYIESMAQRVARYTRCKIRFYAEYNREDKCWMSRVYGYESDVRYFMFLYTTLRLHFIGALLPKVDPAESLDENCYRIHNAGYNWRGIAELYGWRKAKSSDLHSTSDISMVEPWVSPTGTLEEGKRMAIVFKRAARRECARRGEELLLHINPATYRRSAAEGYRDQMNKRLHDQEHSRQSSNALAIRIDDLEQFYREENRSSYHLCPACKKLSAYAWQCDVCGNTEGMAPPPPDYEPCQKCLKNPSGTCRDHPAYGGRWKKVPFSQAGYNAGTRQANTADISGRNVGHTARAID